MIEVDFGRVHLLEIEFREFQEFEPQNKASRAKLYIRRDDTEVGMVTAYHLAGRLGADVVASVGLGKCRQLRMWSFRRRDQRFFLRGTARP